MAAPEPPLFSLHLILIAVIAICLCISCTAGCISFPTGSDEAAYQPPTFGPTLRPTHIPLPSPTIVCKPVVAPCAGQAPISPT